MNYQAFKEAAQPTSITWIREDPFKAYELPDNEGEVEDPFADSFQLFQVIALYDNSGDGELTIHKNDIITVIGEDGEWYTGELNGSTGLVPKNYTKPYSQRICTTSTWKELVAGSHILNGMSSDEIKRQEAIYEFIRTEEIYLEKLRLCYEYFIIPLKGLMDFGNFHELIKFHEKFFKTISMNVGKIQDLDVFDLFKPVQGIPMTPQSIQSVKREQLFIYFEFLSRNIQIPPHLQQKVSELAREKHLKNLDLNAYLLEPMQRITRYPLLLKQIIHYTPKNVNNKLIETLKLSEKFLQMMNLFVKLLDSSNKIAEIKQKYKVPFELAQSKHGERLLVHEGTLFKAKSGRKLKVFLFTDLILFTENDGVYRDPVLLEEIRLKYTDELLVIEPLGIQLRANSLAELKTWITRIDSCLNDLLLVKNDKSVPTKETNGTMILTVLELESKLPEAFVVAELNGERVTSRHVRRKGRIQQKFMLSVSSLDDFITFEVWEYRKFEACVLKDSSRWKIDVVEYYKGDTEDIRLAVGDSYVKFKMNYRPFY